jgi:hypothetical protein
MQKNRRNQDSQHMRGELEEYCCVTLALLVEEGVLLVSSFTTKKDILVGVSTVSDKRFLKDRNPSYIYILVYYRYTAYYLK